MYQFYQQSQKQFISTVQETTSLDMKGSEYQQSYNGMIPKLPPVTVQGGIWKKDDQLMNKSTENLSPVHHNMQPMLLQPAGEQ